jgi:hypothetical protein
MEQYPIPQFIEQEGKIAFFISFRQFFYLCGGGVICFVLYYTVPFAIFAILSLIVMVATGALAFLVINGMPLANILLSSVGFLAGSKNYTWKKKESAYPFKAVKRIQIRKIDEGPKLQAQTSRLKKIHTQVELRSK